MSTAYWLQGDTRRTLATMAAAGIVVDLVVCSPPFLGQRAYLPDGHPDKGLEMGSEPNPGEFIDGLIDVTEACDQVVAPHGSLCVELGDKSSGSGGAGGDYTDTGLRAGQPRFGSVAGRGGWPAPKCWALTPELYRVALAYGFNPLTGRTTKPWRVRNVVRWVRPNPPVGDDGDKFRSATSDIVIACRTNEAGRQRYWDGDAVRVPASPNTNARVPKGVERMPNTRPKAGIDPHDHRDTLDRAVDSGTAPLLDWWQITGFGYPGAHYATYPPKLVEPLIKAMCPERVCTICGEPSRRIVETETSSATGKAGVLERRRGQINSVGGTGETHIGIERRSRTVGWTDCGHNAWRPGIVLDPFAGSGTTLAVTTGHGRDAIGVDLDARNVDLARDRVGPLFFHETTVEDLALALADQRAGDRGAA